MSEASIDASGERVTVKGRNRCATCGVSSHEKTLSMHKPRGLTYEEQKAYEGEFYCNSHLPLFREMPTKSFDGVVL